MLSDAQALMLDAIRGRYGVDGVTGSKPTTKSDPVDATSLVKIAMMPGRSGNAAFSVYAALSESAAYQLERKTGLNLKGYAHGMDESAIRYILGEHGNPDVESSRGQVAVTPNDFLKLADWTDPEKVDSVEYAGKDAKGLDRILYRTRENGHVVVVEEVRQKRKRLALVTLWKTRAAPDAPRSSGSPAQTPETFRARSPQGTGSIPEPREPWEMTRDEMVRTRIEKHEAELAGLLAQVRRIPGNLTRKKDNRGLKIAAEDARLAPRIEWLEARIRHLRAPEAQEVITRLHREDVEKALAAGKPVPPEVLAEYPELVKSLNPFLFRAGFKQNSSTVDEQKAGNKQDGPVPPDVLAEYPVVSGDISADSEKPDSDDLPKTSAVEPMPRLRKAKRLSQIRAELGAIPAP